MTTPSSHHPHPRAGRTPARATFWERTGALVDRVFDAQLVIAMCALVAMMLLVLADVLMRNLLGAPIRGTFELVELLLAIAFFYSLPKIVADGSHLVLELIDPLVSSRTVVLLNRIGSLVGTLILVFLFYAMVQQMLGAYRWGDRMLEIDAPKWIIWAVALVGFAGAILATLRPLLPTKKARAEEVSAR